MAEQQINNSTESDIWNEAESIMQNTGLFMRLGLRKRIRKETKKRCLNGRVLYSRRYKREVRYKACAEIKTNPDLIHECTALILSTCLVQVMVL